MKTLRKTVTAAPTSLAKNPLNLIWVDCEMTGLDTVNDILLEVAVVITSPDLSVRVNGPTIAIWQPETILERMDDWCKNTHGKSGLLDRVRAAKMRPYEAISQELIAFCEQYVGANESPMCGSTVSFDRIFLKKELPTFEKFFNYRHIDVTSFNEMAKRWNHTMWAERPKDSEQHLAMIDIHESIDQLSYYRHLFA